MSKTRAKGTAYETALVNYLKEHGFPNVVRNPLNSPFGDLDGLPCIAEAKNHKAISLSEWMKQAEKSGTKASKLFALFVKRPQHSVEKSYVVFELEQAVKMLKAYEKELNQNID